MHKPIRLGLLAPLTGLVSLYGAEICHGAKIACDHINRGGGILGRPLELIIADDGSLPATAVPAALRLIEQEHCVAIIGNLLSNSRIAVAEQVAQVKRIPLLNFSFYEGSIMGRYFFHFAALPNQQIDRMIPYMGEHYGLKMFFAGNNYEWPRGSIDAAKRSLRKLGGDVVGEEYLPIGACAADIDHLLEQVERSGADVFVPYFAGSDQMNLLTRFTEMGLKNRMAVVMGHYDEVMVSGLSPEVREGFYSSNTYFMSVDTPENKQYLTQLAGLPGIVGVWPHGNGIQSNFGEGTNICVRAFAQAATAAACVDTEKLVDALEQVSVAAAQGLVVMDAATHHAHVNTYLARCNADGTFTIIEVFGQLPPLIPERYQQSVSSPKLHEASITPQNTARLATAVSDAIRDSGTAHQILSMANLAIMATDAQGDIIESNLKASLMFGYGIEEMKGMSMHQLLPPHIRLRHTEALRQFIKGESTERHMAQDREVIGYRKDGSFFPLEASIAKVKIQDTWMLVATMRDITAQKCAEQALLQQATHDSLTKLANRTLIRERINNALERSLRNQLSVGLLFIDLDGFKLINDTHGREVGDALLQSVASRLVEQVRPGDTVARLGGDEFVVLCEQLEQNHTVSVIAERIINALKQAIVINHRSLFITTSVGIAIGHGSTHTADDLLRAADTAMYAVKEKGRDGWQFFNQRLQAETHQRLAITQGLRTAIQNEELSARFQPIVSAQDGSISGAELLLRWHPASGEIPPSVFIPISETTGAILAIGTWVFRRGCQAQADWQRRWGERAPSYISINVSTRQLGEAHLVQEFNHILRETGADPSRILLEVTETSLMADVETNLRVLRQLTDLGLRVAVDDFGTGYSSLAQLTRMPVSVLKIDKAFIDGIENNSESRTVVRAIIGLARALGLQLVAEGVENQAQLAELRNHGCDFIQGYLFYRPLEETTFIKTFEANL